MVPCLQQWLQAGVLRGESTRMVLLPSTFAASCNPQQRSFPWACPVPLESMQTLSIHDVCEQEFTAQGHPEGGTTSCAVSWTCHLLLSSAGAPFLYQKECAVDPLFQCLSMPFINFCEALPPPFSCLFFRLFCSLSRCSSYRSSFILLIILLALFWNPFSLSTPFWERKTRTACRIEGMSKPWTYIVIL